MGITNTNKIASKSEIDCQGTFNLTISLAAAPDILENPADIVLILDRSSSMGGSRFANLKMGAKKFIQILDEATDSAGDGNLGNGSRIGIVSFATTATVNTELTSSVATLNSAVDSLKFGGSTNHEDAFEKALPLLDTPSKNQKVMVMFTDGITTAGGSATAITALAKSKGIVIYCIGLEGAGTFSVESLNDWASSPSSAYVSLSPTDAELEDTFATLAKNIVKPGATDIILTDRISKEFKVLSLMAPSKGVATIVDDQTVHWSIGDVGTVTSEGVSLTLVLQHIGNSSGIFTVNDSVLYEDVEGNVVEFVSPEVTVICDTPSYVEECPAPVEITVGGCSDTVLVDVGETSLGSLGRIIEVNAVLKEVCPSKRVAVAAILTEVDASGVEHKRGMKTILIPASQSQSCENIELRCIKFVVPEELHEGDPGCFCCERQFKVRILANYVDFDFDCCNVIL